MQSYISVKNSSKVPVISVFCDDAELFSDITRGSAGKFRVCRCGSRAISVYDNRKRLIFDLWLSFRPDARHILEIFDGHFRFISVPHV